MKNQALFSSKDKSKKSKCRLLQFSFVALSAKHFSVHFMAILIHCCKMERDRKSNYFSSQNDRFEYTFIQI